MKFSSIITPSNRAKFEKRFWEKVKIGNPKQCWLWQGAISKSTKYDRYGKVKLPQSKITERAHRVSYYLSTGKDPEGVIMHCCDNPSCCNPDHLMEGTHLENMKDMVSKNRHKTPNQYGDINGNAKLSEDEVREIWILIEKGLTNKEIATKYNVTHSNISSIRRRKSWIHLVL